MTTFKTVLFALCLLACAALAPAHAGQKTSLHAAQDTSAEDAPSDAASPQAAPAKPESSKPALSAPAFEKMMDNGQPSSEKNMALGKLGGEWHCKTAFWAVPGAEPKWTKGVFRNEMTLDGRFLSTSFVGELDVGGNSAMVNGKGMIGYDNVKQAYSSVWADTLSTSMMIGTGKYDARTKTITETGSFANPLTGAEAKFRSELEFTNSDDYKRTVFVVGKSGKETKLMEFDCDDRPGK